MTYSTSNIINDPYNLSSYSNKEKYIENFVPIDYGGIVSRKELKQAINNAAVQQQIVAEHKKQDIAAAEKTIKTEKLKKLAILVAEHRARSGELVKSADKLEQEVKNLENSINENGY